MKNTKNTIQVNYNTNSAKNTNNSKKKPVRIRDWTEYNKSLVQRGNIALLVSPAVFLPPKHTKRPGRKQKYSDALILFLAELREILQKPFRQTIGTASNLGFLQGVELPSPNRLCTRMKELNVEQKLDRRRFKKPVCLLVDSTGLKTTGEGEWKVRKHGAGYRRGWRKVHIAIDHITQLITAHEITPETTADQIVLPTLLDDTLASNIKVRQTIGDGAYGSHKLYQETEEKRGISLLSPPHKNARLHVKFAKPHHGRGGSGGKYADLIDEVGWETHNRYLRGCLHLGWDEWKNQIGYHKRSLVETTMWRLKSAFSSQLKSRSSENQIVETAIRIKLLNLWTMQNQVHYQTKT